MIKSVAIVGGVINGHDTSQLRENRSLKFFAAKCWCSQQLKIEKWKSHDLLNIEDIFPGICFKLQKNSQQLSSKKENSVIAWEPGNMHRYRTLIYIKVKIIWQDTRDQIAWYCPCPDFLIAPAMHIMWPAVFVLKENLLRLRPRLPLS